MTHQCPWPGCTVQAEERYWGCAPHWRVLPGYLWKMWHAGMTNGSGVAQACDAIGRWIIDRGEETLQGKVLHEMAKINAGFATGATADGKMILFWPGANEYLLLSKEEVRQIVRTARVLFSAAP